MMSNTVCAEIEAWLNTWQEDPLGGKKAFMLYYKWFQDLANVSLEFKQRAGVSYSLRAKHENQAERSLFVLVDVVDDEPEARWLSVCFYADMINDPDELGDFVPQGLMGSDALCLNLEEDDEAMQNYVFERIKEAAENAAKK